MLKKQFLLYFTANWLPQFR